MEGFTSPFLNLASHSVYFSTSLVVNSTRIICSERNVPFLVLRLNKHDTGLNTSARTKKRDYNFILKDIYRTKNAHRIFVGKPDPERPL
jgi:hypothetical protein